MKKIILLYCLFLIATTHGAESLRSKGIIKPKTKQQKAHQKENQRKKIINHLNRALFHTARAKERMEANGVPHFSPFSQVSSIIKDNTKALRMLEEIENREQAQRDRKHLFKLLEKTQKNTADVSIDISLAPAQPATIINDCPLRNRFTRWRKLPEDETEVNVED